MPRFPTRPGLALLGTLLGLAACAPTATVSMSPTTTATTATTATQAPTVAATASPSPNLSDCSSFTPEPVYPTPQLPFALPPNTVWNEEGSAAGANLIIACTPRTSPGGINAFLNAEVARAGWRQWDPQTEHATACAHDNSYWRWSKGEEAVGWDYLAPHPFWNLTFCNLTYGA
jgi:hypothetical protein